LGGRLGVRGQAEAGRDVPVQQPRVFVGGIGHESCGFTPLRTALGDFQVLRGDQLLRAGGVLAGALAALRAEGAVPVPGLSAWAGVSGLVERAAWDRLAGELVSGLAAAGPGLRGVFLSLHGSLTVDGLDDAQGLLLEDVRAAVGPGVPVVAALDLHASVTPRMVGAADAFVGFRTAPHRDQRETGARAAGLLGRMVREGLRPAMVQVRVPLLLPGEFAQTETEPTAGLWRRAAALEDGPGVWCVSILDGFPWVDAPFNEASVVVVGDAAVRARAAAEALAADLWAARAAFYSSVPALPLPEGLRAAAAWAGEGRAVVLSDTGDNPTAGAPQDRADVLVALQEAGIANAVAALLVDAPAVAAAIAAGHGGAVDLEVGGTLAPGAGPRARLRGRVLALRTGTAAGTACVIEDRGLRAVVGERRLGMTDPGFLRALGIEPFAPGQILVLKIGYLFPAYADELRTCPHARSLLLLTPGATSLDPRTFPYRRVHRPVYPLDADAAADLSRGTTVRGEGPLLAEAGLPP
jgi:microcystin degradation protein MlrC